MSGSTKPVKQGGFRNALRRLLRKTPLPAGDGSAAAASPAVAGGGSQQQQTVQGGFLDGPRDANGGSNLLPASSSSLNQATATTAKGDKDDDDWSQALHGDFSNIVKSHAHDDEAAILRNTAAAARDSRGGHAYSRSTDEALRFSLAADGSSLRGGGNTTTARAGDKSAARHTIAAPAAATAGDSLTNGITTTATADTLTPDDLTTTTTATDDPTMAPARPLSQQTRPTQKPSLAAQLPPKEENKENVPPENLTEPLADSLAGLKIASPQKVDAVKPTSTEVAAEPTTEQKTETDEQPEIDYDYLNDPVVAAERAQHLRFIGEALDMARLALKINETPVGCVLVHNGKVIARGMNATNVTRNGTRHAEYMALAALFSYAKADGPRSFRLKPKVLTDREEEEKAAARLAASDEDIATETELPDGVSETLSTGASPHDGNEDGKKGHLYPYGQKIIDMERVDRSIVSECVLYVTVEPCIMCASLLRQLRIKKVYFGAVNDKFGGTGGVFSLHANSLPVRADGQTAAAHPIAKPIQLPDGTGGSLGVSFPPGGGDGGNVEPGYEIEGGWGRDDAVALLRRFYVQENGRAPVPRKKEGRAARLAAIMGQDGVEGDADGETVTPSEGADTNGAATDDVRKQSSESSYEDAQMQINGVNGYEA